MLWVRHDLENRLEFLQQLLKSIKMPLIPVSYFMKTIENDDLLKSCLKSNLNLSIIIILVRLRVIMHWKTLVIFSDFLYDSMKMYLLRSASRSVCSSYYLNRKKIKNNQVNDQHLLIVYEKEALSRFYVAVHTWIKYARNRLTKIEMLSKNYLSLRICLSEKKIYI